MAKENSYIEKEYRAEEQPVGTRKTTKERSEKERIEKYINQALRMEEPMTE